MGYDTALAIFIGVARSWPAILEGKTTAPTRGVETFALVSRTESRSCRDAINKYTTRCRYTNIGTKSISISFPYNAYSTPSRCFRSKIEKLENLSSRCSMEGSQRKGARYRFCYVTVRAALSTSKFPFK